MIRLIPVLNIRSVHDIDYYFFEVLIWDLQLSLALLT